MQKLVFSFFVGLLIVGCKNEPSNQNNTTASHAKQVDEQDMSKVGQRNYAVTWRWTTNKVQSVVESSPVIAKELSTLWKNGVVENAYYDNDSKVDKLDNLPNIAFFLKAKSVQEAKSILNELTIVKKHIASYKLHQVGTLWLDRKTDLINKQGMTRSYATVWTTTKSPLIGEDADVLLKKQSDALIKLWNEGKVENAYFDIEGTYEENKITDFVFFVNANSEVEARQICESLPFFETKKATYKLFQAGVFWMGKYEDMPTSK